MHKQIANPKNILEKRVNNPAALDQEDEDEEDRSEVGEEEKSQRFSQPKNKINITDIDILPVTIKLLHAVNNRIQIINAGSLDSFNEFESRSDDAPDISGSGSENNFSLGRI